MAFCGKCGTQLSEGAKFCPKCGNPIGTTQNEKETRIEREIPNESFTENEEAEEEGLSSLEKIALGTAGVIAIFGICYGAFESHYIVTISILAIVAIGYSFIGGIERKHIWTTVLGSIVAVFLTIGVFSSGDKEEEKTQVEHKQEKKENNPYAKFMGKYVLYDDEGRTSFFHFKVDKKGNFLQSLGITDEYNNYGSIDIVSDDAFCVSLYGTTKIYINHDEDKWPWANTDKVKCGMRYHHFGPNTTLRIDIKEKRLYPDNEEYKNREYKLPHYYKFRFTKQ